MQHVEGSRLIEQGVPESLFRAYWMGNMRIQLSYLGIVVAMLAEVAREPALAKHLLRYPSEHQLTQLVQRADETHQALGVRTRLIDEKEMKHHWYHSIGCLLSALEFYAKKSGIGTGIADWIRHPLDPENRLAGTIQRCFEEEELVAISGLLHWALFRDRETNRRIVEYRDTMWERGFSIERDVQDALDFLRNKTTAFLHLFGKLVDFCYPQVAKATIVV